MAGTVVVDTVKSSTTSPPAFQNTNGTEIGTLCRAWVRFAGSTGTVNAGFNVSSVTRNTTGDYTVNFTNTLPDANYAMAGVVGSFTTGSSTRSICVSSSAAPTTSACRIVNTNPAGSAEDPTNVYIAFFR